MMKHEFIQHVNSFGNPLKIEDLDDETYRVIEHVYNYHPSVSNKDAIARIYCMNGGMQIIRDMVHTADEWMRRDEEIGKVRLQMAALQKKLDDYARDLRVASGRA